MSTRLFFLLAMLLGLGALTAMALLEVGYWGLFEPALRSWGAGQVLADLVIALLLVIVWMVGDGRTSGVNPWPFVVLTLAAGSFGPLCYLVVREMRATRTDRGPGAHARIAGS